MIKSFPAAMKMCIRDRGKRLFCDVEKRLVDDIAVFVRFGPAVAVRVAVALLRVFKVEGRLLAHHDRYLVFAKLLAREVAAADKLRCV